MFSFLKGKQPPALAAPLSGRVIPIDEVPDPVFAQQVLGDGVGIVPSDGALLAPADGTVIQVAETLHAVGIETADGLELLIHLGIDTVKLGGEGFRCLVKEGQKVKKGERLLEMDLAFLRGKGFDTTSPFIITNPDRVASLQPLVGEAVAGETTVLRYKMK